MPLKMSGTEAVVPLATDGIADVPNTATTSRDEFIDLVRAGSLLVVVIWHWVFTILVWHADGPHASNPIGRTSGAWVLTWVFQVMPAFFFVGGFVHYGLWNRAKAKGTPAFAFFRDRLVRLLIPAFALIAVMWLLKAILQAVYPDVDWFGRAFILVISPLWFLAVYVLVVLTVPTMVWLHNRWGIIVPVVLAAIAVWVDVLRFKEGVNWVAWINMLVVWLFVHQLGFFWPQLKAMSRQAHWALMLGGFLALSALTNLGLYPRSMVGVPGERISNMGPPTVCIAALAIGQIGLLLLIRPGVIQRMERPRWRRFVSFASSYSMGIFVWHAMGFAILVGLLRLAGWDVPQTDSWQWWAQRPLFLLAPIATTAPLVLAFRPFESLGQRAKSARRPSDSSSRVT
jgi:hypothetical protein